MKNEQRIQVPPKSKWGGKKAKLLGCNIASKLFCLDSLIALSLKQTSVL